MREEKTLRQQIRSDLAEWTKVALRTVGLSPAKHHLRLISELESVSRGEVDRLLVLMPPGAAKSTYASILFPAWWFSQHPQSSVIGASHTASLATHFSRQIRNMVAEHGPRLGYQLAPDQRTAASWRTKEGATYHSAGVHGQIVGRRADLVIIDDPLKSQSEADSQLYRDHVWTWYRSDLVPRLKPGGRVIVIMTRWHEDDLGGRLLQSNEAWRSLCLPALAGTDDPLGRKPGEALWPEWEDEEALLRKRESIGERAWSSLFQQQPTQPESGMFRVDRVAILASEPVPDGPVVRAWDLAATFAIGARDPDWTVGLKLMRTAMGRFVVLDVIRFRGGPYEVDTTIIESAQLDGKNVIVGLPQDPGQAGRAQVLHLTGKLAGYKVSSSLETGSKITRASPIASQCGAGNLAIVRAHWNALFLEELQSFPTGRKDDQVDALSRAFAMLTPSAPPTRVLRLPILAR